jgi:hypothetical protein
MLYELVFDIICLPLAIAIVTALVEWLGGGSCK